jgi:NTE family protein
MPETPPERVGLCLSGGGFRASFFALGALRYLAESGGLDRVVAVSAVSGGSIAAAAVADRWTDYEDAGGGLEAFLTTIDEPFRATVTEKSVRRRWIARSLAAILPIYGRDDAYAGALGKTLYRHKRVADLPKRPEFIFTSTDLATGRTFRVAAAYIGSYDYGYIETAPTVVSLGKAVAASAAFPPSMTIVRLKT